MSSNSTVGGQAPHAEPKEAVTAAWLVFVASICAAAAVDGCYISRARPGSSTPVYAKQILFWLLAGASFALFVTGSMGPLAGGSWTYGYFLEYMLSIDNLFVFQLVFKAYSTPETQVERALFWGIAAAVALRFAFFGIGTEILSLGFGGRLLFGLLLVYSGFKAFSDSDEEEDPSKNLLVRCVARLLPLHDHYSDEPAFFVWMAKGSPSKDLGAAPAPRVLGSQGEDDIRLRDMMDHGEDAAEVQPMGRMTSAAGATCKVTPLFLVVLTLALIDVIFAVDSVTAKISSVVGFHPDVSFFLNLSSSAFAMFVLRSLYLVVDMLTHMFRFLGYGVGAVLIFIGVKLMVSGWFEVGMLLSSVLILGLLSLAILASLLLPETAAESQNANDEDLADPPGPGMYPDKPYNKAPDVFAIELEAEEKPAA